MKAIGGYLLVLGLAMFIAGCGGGGGTANTAPAVSFTMTADGLSVACDASATQDTEDGSNIEVCWGWGDGETTSFGTERTATHTYAQGGLYTIYLTARDSAGMTNTLTRNVMVSVEN